MRHLYQIAIAALLSASLGLTGCQEASTYAKVEPAHVEHVEGSEISRVTLTEKAIERIGVQTAPVREQPLEGSEDKQARLVVDYGAIMYVANGDTFVYTSPQPRTYVRHPVSVDFIEGDLAVLKEGPPAGTQVVTVGAAELFGTEFGVGH